MLRGSTANIGTDLAMVTQGATSNDETVPHADLFIDLAEGVQGRDSGKTETARNALIDALGTEALVDAAAVCAQFNAITRVADATGIQLDTGIVAMSETIREELGINAFNTTVEQAD